MRGTRILTGSTRDKLLNALLAFFSLGTFAMYYLTIPLWAITLEASPLLIGIAVGIRPLLPALLSIHGGALMDRLGVRNVLIVAGVIGVLTPLAITAFPAIGALIVLQLIGGLSEGLGWLGAQTRLGQVAKGDTDAAGWFTGAGKLGTLVAPIVAGFTWDLAGPTATFALTAIWAGGLLVTVLLLPKVNRPETPAANATESSGTDARVTNTEFSGAARDRFVWRELLPKWSDYRTALGLFAIPLVAIVCFGTFLRLSAFGVQGSFYPVYLESIGVAGSVIGILIGFSSFTGSPSAIVAPSIAKKFGSMKVMIAAVLIAIVGVTAPPLVSSTPMLFVLAGLFGIGVGVTLPIMLSLLSEATPPEHQGIAAGLRATVNRLGNLVVPVMMGALVQMFGLQTSFILTGLILSIGAAGMIFYATRHQLFDRST